MSSCTFQNIKNQNQDSVFNNDIISQQTQNHQNNNFNNDILALSNTSTQTQNSFNNTALNSNDGTGVSYDANDGSVQLPSQQVSESDQTITNEKDADKKDKKNVITEEEACLPEKYFKDRDKIYDKLDVDSDWGDDADWIIAKSAIKVHNSDLFNKIEKRRKELEKLLTSDNKIIKATSIMIFIMGIFFFLPVMITGAILRDKNKLHMLAIVVLLLVISQVKRFLGYTSQYVP